LARPPGLQIATIMFVGTIGIPIPGVQPIVLGALLPPRRLRAISLVASLVLAVGNWLTPLAMGESVTALRAVTGAAGGVPTGSRPA
jgi:hypothetical protein